MRRAVATLVFAVGAFVVGAGTAHATSDPLYVRVLDPGCSYTGNCIEVSTASLLGPTVGTLCPPNETAVPLPLPTGPEPGRDTGLLVVVCKTG